MVCFPGYSRRTLAFLGLTFFMQVVVNSTYAIIAPFFPLEAIELGLDTAQVAVVFGSFAVVQLGISPIAGGLCSKFGRRRVLIVGVFIVSGGTFLFGLVPPAALSLGIPMMPLFIVARVLQGTGSALTMTCIFAILSDAFPDSRGRIIGVAEMMNSLGWTVGPPMGGLLFAIGGFTLPFLICGALPLLTLAGVLSVFPEGGTTPRAVPVALSTSEAEADQMDAEDEEVDHADQASCVALLQRARRLATPGLFVTAFAATTPGTIFALWDIGFTPFVVEEFGFSLETVGLYFAIGPGMYMLLTSAAGFVVDKVDQKKYIIGTATTLIGLNFMSLGPYQDNLGFSVLTKEILLGVTFGGMGLICPFIIVPIIPDMHASHADALRAARHGRPPKTNEHTTNLISSLASTSFNAGGMIGPLLGSLTLPTRGFRGAAQINGAIAACYGLLVLVYAKGCAPPPPPREPNIPELLQASGEEEDDMSFEKDDERAALVTVDV